MSKISIEGNALGTGTFTIASPNSNTSRTLTLPDNTGTIITQNSTPAFASTIGVGGATAAASGAGITFPATQSASSDVNTLDDYEEGTFTPTLVGGFSVAPTSYTEQAGRYTKIGRIVYVEIALDPNGATANASRIRFGGLPFTTASGGPWSGGIIAYQASFNTNAGDVLFIQATNTTIDFYTNTGAERNGNAANVNINNLIRICATYTAA
jgi:hypothetical protein